MDVVTCGIQGNFEEDPFQVVDECVELQDLIDKTTSSEQTGSATNIYTVMMIFQHAWVWVAMTGKIIFLCPAWSSITNGAR